MLRDRAGGLRAFVNVCRHRGSRVCLEAQGSAKAMVCPYHAWTYALDGELIGAKAMPEGFDTSGLGLKRCAVRVFEGMIYVCLDADRAPDRSSSSSGRRCRITSEIVLRSKRFVSSGS